MSDQTTTDLREEVRSKYAAAARAVLEPRSGVTAESVELSATGSCCGSPAADSCCGGAAAEAVGGFSEDLYREGETDGLPEEAVLASLGCGNPIAVADLHEGKRVLDLGSGSPGDALGDHAGRQARYGMSPALGRRLVAEFTGTGLLVAIVVGSGIAATRLTTDGAVRLLVNSVVTAMGLAVLILVFIQAGGAHFNPVVTAADWVEEPAPLAG